MPRCGCATPDCGCTLTAGEGVVITGQGSAENPYIVSTNEGLTKIRAQSTSTIQLIMTGAGTSTNPYVLSAVRIGSSVTANTKVDVIDATSTWTKPSGKNFIKVAMVGGGGGGASGAVAPAGTAYSVGGGGGAGGGYSEFLFLASEIGATINVVVGQGGAGGVAASGAGIGVKGQNGTDTTFGSFRAGGGKGGVWLGNATTVVAADFAGGIGTEYGANGTQTATYSWNESPGPDGINAYQAGPSGGAGGSPNVDDGYTTATCPGGSGGNQTADSLTGGIGATPSALLPAGNGQVPPPTGVAGSAGGGGSGVYSVFSAGIYRAATDGGDGALGAGGGGGGGGLASYPLSGAGGSGGNGRVVITSW